MTNESIRDKFIREVNKFVNLKEEDFVSEKHTSPDVL